MIDVPLHSGVTYESAAVAARGGGRAHRAISVDLAEVSGEH